MGTRRDFLKAGAVAPLALLAPGAGAAPGRNPGHPPRLAVILTQYGANSHGICYCTKFLEGKQFDDHFEEPRCQVVSMHLKEISKDDIGIETAKRHNVPMYPSVATALCLGGEELAVDGVVIIGEHGTYPINAKGQQLYPRRELFDQVIGVFRQSGRVVPIFNDKHMSWNWAWAKYMWRTLHTMKIPWMAGSSLPYAKFEPLVPLPHGKRLDPIVAVGYGGLESYGFHALETGQRIAECRAGGECGVASVQVLSGADVWEAQSAGRWPKEIAEAAFGAVKTPKGKPQDFTKEVYAFDITYLDGQRMTVLLVNGYSEEFAFAYRVAGKREIVAASYFLDPVPRLKHFSATVRALEEMYLTGKPTARSERTYLTTGILAYGVESHYQGDVLLQTPDLDIAYRPMPVPAHWKEVLRQEHA